MKTRAEGPYTFLQYKNTAGWVARVESQEGRRLEVSAANLIPLKGKQNLPTPGLQLAWEDPPQEERYAVKRKRTKPPTSPPPAPDIEPDQPTLPPPPVTASPYVWENPLFHRSHPQDFSSDEDDEGFFSDDPADFQAAARQLPPMP